MSISTNSAENNTIIVNAHRKQLNRTVLNGPEKHVILNTCKVSDNQILDYSFQKLLGKEYILWE